MPNTPTGVTATGNSATSVTVNWTDNSSGETHYEVERSTGGAWTPLTTTLAPNASSYTDTTALEATAYQYRVRGNRNGTESAYSSTASVTTIPAAPSGVSVTSSTSTRVTLGWTDNSSGETGFRVLRSTDGGTTWSQSGTPGANSTTFSDNTVTEGIAYTYVVQAYNTTGNSANSNTVTANIVPAAPTGLATTSVTAGSVALTWTNHSAHQSGFYVERSTDGGTTWTQVSDVTGGATSYSDTTAEASSYQYRVRAHGTTGNSSYSSSIAVNTPVSAPTGLAATTISTTEIDLAWTDNSSAESGFSLQRSTDGGTTWSSTIALGANTTSYPDTGLTEGTTYTYHIQATRTGKNSAYTGIQTATTLPAAPSAVTATAASDTQVTVNWTNNSVGATGITIERSTNNVAWTVAGTVGTGITTYADTGLTELTAYYYRVKATNAGGSSAYGVVGSTVTTLPSAPSSLALTAPAADRIALTWTDNSVGATGYKVERSSNGGGTWTQLVVLGASATSYTDLTVAEATTYTYRVRAVAGGINSSYCASQTLTTLPLAPDTLNASTISTSEIDLTWDNNSAGPTHYLVERSLDGGNTWSPLVTLGPSASSYNNTGLTEGTDYQYRVRAQDAGGYSGYTASADATTFPTAPSGLAGQANAGHNDLTWSDNSSGETGYTVERSADGGTTWVAIANLPADSNSASDTGAVGGLASSTSYRYRVFCSNTGGDSALSNVVTLTAV